MCSVRGAGQVLMNASSKWADAHGAINTLLGTSSSTPQRALAFSMQSVLVHNLLWTVWGPVASSLGNHGPDDHDVE